MTQVYALSIFHGHFLWSSIEDWSPIGWWSRKTTREFTRMTMRKVEMEEEAIEKGHRFAVFLVPSHKLRIVVYRPELGRPRLVVAAREDYPLSALRQLMVQTYPHLIMPPGTLTQDTPGEALAADPALADAFRRLSDPGSLTKIDKVKAGLKDVREIILDSIDKVLERGVKLDEMVEKSNDLSAQSKLFYKRTKKLNSCCVVA